LAQARGSVPVQHAVTIEVVEGPIEHCPKCGWSRNEHVASTNGGQKSNRAEVNQRCVET
jgi:hypothetical protein